MKVGYPTTMNRKDSPIKFIGLLQLAPTGIMTAFAKNKDKKARKKLEDSGGASILGAV
jgi:hypothetical protein